MTIDEKANQFTTEFMKAYDVRIARGDGKMPASFDEVANITARILREHDWETRHACAEALLQMGVASPGGMIHASDAHAKCMNVRG